VTTKADGDLLTQYRDWGGPGPACGGFKVCWGPDESKARKLADELWPTSGIPGQLHQDLPTPTHFEQAAQIVTEDQATKGTPCGPDPEPYVAQLRTFVDAGFDEVSITQIGPDQEGFFRFYESELRARLGV
jgi:G6PDH family F420-dependent oxidoreductase